MKTIKNWEQFNEAAKKYTNADHDKDEKRIQDMADKADHDEKEMVKLANTMANRITNVVKAENRGGVAKALGFKKVAKVFLDRAKELMKMNEK